MMIDALKEALPMAIGLILSPFPLIAVLMMLLTPRARVNAPALMVGYIIGIYSVGLLIFLWPGLETNNGSPSTFSSMIRIFFGVSLLILSFRSWRNRPRSDVEVTTPKLFVTIDQFGLRKSVLTGFLFSVVNIKNAALSASGAARIDSVLQDDPNAFLALALFSIVGSLQLIVPVFIFFAVGKKIDSTFQRIKKWLIRYNSILLAVILALIGMMFIKGGLVGFLK